MSCGIVNKIAFISVIYLCVGCLKNQYRQTSGGVRAQSPLDFVDASNSLEASVLTKSEKLEEAPHQYKVFRKVAPGVYRFFGRKNVVWSALLDVLIENYSFHIVDQEGGILATDWDRYSTQDYFYRNKISARITPSSWSMTDVKLFNNLEFIERKRPTAHAGLPIWQPSSEDPLNETQRILDNVAKLLTIGNPSPKVAESQAQAIRD